MKRTILALILLIGSHAFGQVMKDGYSFDDATRDFFFNDFGSINFHSLQTHSLPSPVAATALVLEGRKQGWIAKDSLDFRSVLAHFGFFTPNQIVNAPAVRKEHFPDLPMGLTTRDLPSSNSPIAMNALNVSCASCHAGRLYDSSGKPTQDAFWGLPNTSINMNSYINSVYDGLKIVEQDPDASYQLMKQIFPDLSLGRRATMKLIIDWVVTARVKKLKRLYDQALPFSNGGPGVTNGVAALKYTLKFMDRNKLQPEYGFTSIPSLGDRLFRSSLLYDGVYAPPGVPRFESRSSWNEVDLKRLSEITGLFTIPTMGQSPRGALKNLPRVEKALAQLLPNYQAPQFPGYINQSRAKLGEIVYQRKCQECHGTYAWSGPRPTLKEFPNRLVPQSWTQTDPERWKAITPEFVQSFNSLKIAEVAVAKRSEGYVAPLLNSLWASAPYLHNGSVPSLYDLMHAEDLRPQRFMVGGHDLDFEKVGLKLSATPSAAGVFVYPSDVQPWSEPAVYDTQEKGRSNKGHIKPFDELSEAEKTDLLEFLKLL